MSRLLVAIAATRRSVVFTCPVLNVELEATAPTTEHRQLAALAASKATSGMDSMLALPMALRSEMLSLVKMCILHGGVPIGDAADQLPDVTIASYGERILEAEALYNPSLDTLTDDEWAQFVEQVKKKGPRQTLIDCDTNTLRRYTMRLVEELYTCPTSRFYGG